MAEQRDRLAKGLRMGRGTGGGMLKKENIGGKREGKERRKRWKVLYMRAESGEEWRRTAPAITQMGRNRGGIGVTALCTHRHRHTYTASQPAKRSLAQSHV